MSNQTPQAQQTPAAQANAGAANATTAPKKTLSLNDASGKIANLLTPKKPQADNDILAGGDGAQRPKKKASAPPQQKQVSTDGTDPKAKKGVATGDQPAKATGDNPADDDAAAENLEADDAATDDEGNPTEDNPDSEEGSDDADGEGEGSDPLYEITIEGETFEVPFSELVAGYQRQADYTRKTKELAEQRRAVETEKESVKDLPEKKKVYEQGAERFVKNAQLVLTALQHRFMPQPPSPELAKSDPASYLHQKEVYQEALQFAGGIHKELSMLEKQGKEEHQKAVQAGRAKLYEAMPEMAEQANRQKLREYANSLGFTDEQIAQEASHTLFVCVEKARRWDDLQKRKEELRPKKTVQKVMKRTNAAETKKAVQTKQKQNVLFEHKQRGTIQTAEKALASLFQGGQRP